MIVYATIMEKDFWGEKGFNIFLHSTREKAQETLEQLKQGEWLRSWINEIEDIEELENYSDELEYFDCCQYDKRTTIWIEEMEVI